MRKNGFQISRKQMAKLVYLSITGGLYWKFFYDYCPYRKAAPMIVARTKFWFVRLPKRLFEPEIERQSEALRQNVRNSWKTPWSIRSAHRAFDYNGMDKSSQTMSSVPDFENVRITWSMVITLNRSIAVEPLFEKRPATSRYPCLSWTPNWWDFIVASFPFIEMSDNILKLDNMIIVISNELLFHAITTRGLHSSFSLLFIFSWSCFRSKVWAEEERGEESTTGLFYKWSGVLLWNG